MVPSAELQDAYTPTLSEFDWAGGAARSDDHLLALVVLLKCFQRLGYFPRLEEVPGVIVAHVRSCLELGAEVAAGHDWERTLRHHKSLIRTRLDVILEPERARQVAEEAIRGSRPG